jgi:uncharacterized cupredoxin-like copper-binding protein
MRIKALLTPAVVCSLLLLAVSAPAIGQAAVTAHPASVTVKVAASEFKFKLSADSAKPGKVTFVLTNKGHVPHDFRINGVTSKLIGPGKSTSISVDFKKPGSYYYECTVPGHAALGMKGHFKIT